MLLSYRDPQFWKKFRAAHWGPRVPTVIRQPFKHFPFSEAALLKAMKAFERGLRSGDTRATCLVSVGDKEVTPRRPLRDLFRADSGSFAELEAHCGRVFSKNNFGLMITNMQNVDSGIWGPITSFLQDARPWIDFPPRAFLDLFYGNYDSSFTGVHKDTQEIFAFVVRGQKRMLAWPFEYFLPRVEGLGPGDRYFHRRLDIDYRKYRKDALVLDAEPGDVFYWPSDRWHVAEGKPGRFSGMVSLGLFRRDSPPTKLAPESARLRKELLSLQSRELVKVSPKAGGARQLRWVTGFGFEISSPIAERSRGRREATVRVTKNRTSLVLWKSAGDRVLVSTNGHSISLVHSALLVNLLEQIAKGKTVTVSNAPTPGRGTTVSETNWNKHCKLTTRTRPSRRDSGALLVDWLLRVYAVERA